MTEHDQKQLVKTLWNIADCISPLDAEIAVSRVAERVRQGGHGIPEATIRRRFEAGKRLFITVYRPLVDRWVLYDNAGEEPVLIDWSGKP